MINNMDNLNNNFNLLNRLLGADRIVSKDDLNEVLKAITNILSEYKKELSDTSKEQEGAISYLLAEISAKHDNLLEEYKSIKEDTKEDYDEKSEELKTLIEEVKLLSKQVSEIEVKDGKDADEERVISEVLSQIKLPEYKETIIEGGDIVDKINSLPVNEENQIDAKHIKNLPEVSSKVISGGMTKKRVQDMIDASGVSSPLTTKGDLYTYSTINARLPVGTNGKVLSADSTEATGLKWITAGTGDALTTNPLSQFAATTSAQLAGVISDETGSGALVFGTSPTLTTPTLGVASATSINKITLTAPATGSTLTIADGKTLTVNKSITLDGTDSTTMTFPSTSATIARTDAAQTFTGTQTITQIDMGNTDTSITRSAAGIIAVEGVAVPTISSTDTLSNKTLTAPKFADLGFIADANGNEMIIFNTTASAVNEVAITNAATGTTGALIQASGETNVDLRIAGKGTGKVHFTSGTYGDLTSDTDGATVTFNMATSNFHTVTLAGNRTLAVSNVATGQAFLINLKQDGTGSRTVTWFSGISWPAGTTPTLTTTASKTDTFGFLCTGAGAYLGYIVGQNL